MHVNIVNLLTETTGFSTVRFHPGLVGFTSWLEYCTICVLVLARSLRIKIKQYINRPLKKSAYQNYFSYFSTKTYIVGTQKNRLNETVLLRTQNIC